MTDLPRPSGAPCGTCPYRKDVPAGIWDASEYVKLPKFDGSIFDQVVNGAGGLFMCHQADGHLCSGWVGCHGPFDLLALRVNPVDPITFEFESPVPLFASGLEAAEHGLSGVECPDDDALAAIAKLEAKRK